MKNMNFEFLSKYSELSRLLRYCEDAERFADAWRERYPGRRVPKYMETYEISEYGRAPTQEDLDLLLG